MLRALFLMLASFAFAADLKHDDGEPDGSRSIGDVGCAVWFDGPIDTTTVRVHASRGRAAAFDVAAYDRDGRPLARGAWEGTALPEKPGWAKLALRVEAEEGALVVVSFNEGEEGSLSWDKSDEHHSTFFYAGNHRPFEGANWMIRLGDGVGAPPMTFAGGDVPEGATVRADAGAALELRGAEGGHAVRLECREAAVLAGLSVYGARTGRMSRFFTVSVCDDRLRVLRTERVRAGVIGETEGWHTFALPTGPHPEAFWLVLDFHPLAADRVDVGLCRNPAARCGDAAPGSVFRAWPAGDAWMVRAHFLKGERVEPPAIAPGTEEDAAVVGDVARKFFKAQERLDRGRLLDVLDPEAPGLDWLRAGEGELLEGWPQKRVLKEVGREVGANAATLAFATLSAPLLWDPPDELRKSVGPGQALPEGPVWFSTDGPVRHTQPSLYALRFVKRGGDWLLHAWEEADARDVAWGQGILGPGRDAALDALLAQRAKHLAALDGEVRGLEDPAQKERLLSDLARAWAEEGDFEKWKAIVAELPQDAAAMLRQHDLVEGRACLGLGDQRDALRRAVDLADALLAALDRRFGLAPDGRRPLRIVVKPSDQSGFASHPGAWAYPEIVWFATDDDLKRPPDPHGLALAIADACVRFWDDAEQTRRWLAAGMLAEGDFASKETPAALRTSVQEVEPGRDTVEGHLRILGEVSERWGDKAIGSAIAAARRDGAHRMFPHGRLLVLDEYARMLAKGTGKEAEVEELYRRK